MLTIKHEIESHLYSVAIFEAFGIRIAVNDNPVQGFGAGEMNRTPDLRITNALLYQLSYTG